MRSLWWKLHKFIFSLFVIHGLAIGIHEVVGQQRPPTEAADALLRIALRVYLPVASVLVLTQLVLHRRPRLALTFYYRLWIGRVFPWLEYLASSSRFLGRFLSRRLLSAAFSELDRLVLASMTAPGTRSAPLVVRREHLMERSFLGQWAFAIVLLFNNVVLRRIQSRGRSKVQLQVDLRNQSYGIYSSAGKEFIRTHFLGSGAGAAYLDQARRVDDFIVGAGAENEISLIPPFRWASGGGLGVAMWRGRDWFVLSFRGVPPVGWNIANGGSESKDEYKSIHRLILREFCEEIVVLDRRPVMGDRLPIRHKAFRLMPLLDELPEVSTSVLTSLDFHATKRANIWGGVKGLRIGAAGHSTTAPPSARQAGLMQ